MKRRPLNIVVQEDGQSQCRILPTALSNEPFYLLTWPIGFLNVFSIVVHYDLYALRTFYREDSNVNDAENQLETTFLYK